MAKFAVLFMVVLALPSPSALARRHRRGYQPTPELCQIKNVAVKGNSEAASMIRHMVPKRTWIWMQVSPSEKTADAVMSVSETQSEKNFPIRTERTTVSATVSEPGGDLLWSDSTWFGEGVFNSEARSAIKILLAHLNEDAGCADSAKTSVEK